VRRVLRHEDLLGRAEEKLKFLSHFADKYIEDMKLIIERSSAPENPYICRLSGQAKRPPLTRPSCAQIPRPVLESLSRIRGDHYLFGGAVRDSIAGRPPRDYDFVARVNQECLETAGGTRLGNMKDAVEFNSGRFQVHVAPFAEGMTVAEELAEGRSGSITMDVMAMNPKTGELIDPCRGLGDFKAGVVRVVDNHELKTNPQLAFRAFRLAVKYGAGVELTTFETIRDSLVVYARAMQEMRERWRIVRMLAQGLSNGSPLQSLEWWRLSGVMELVIPELHYLSEENRRQYNDALLSCENAPLRKRLSALLEFLDEKDRETIAKRLKSDLNGYHRIEGRDLQVVASITAA